MIVTTVLNIELDGTFLSHDLDSKVADGVDSAFEMIPEADEVHSNIDTAVNA